MKSLNDLKSNIQKKRKRVGRGNGSGHGTFSCKGMKGQNARAGGSKGPAFEGGQTPYVRRLPKLRGFKNPNKVDYQIVTTDKLNIFNDGETVTIAELITKKVISKKNLPVKLLNGKTDLTKKLTIKVNKASKTAIEQVEAKSGKVELV